MKRIAVPTILFLVGFACAASAIDVENIAPAMGPQNLISLYTSDPLAHAEFAFGLAGNYADDPLRFKITPGNKNLNVVRSLTEAQFYFAIGLFNRVDLMLGSAVARAAGPEMNDVGISALPAQTVKARGGFGDTDFAIKVNILPNKPGWAGLAAKVDVGIPTGSAKSYSGAGATTAGADLILDKRIDRVNIVLNGGYRFLGRPKEFKPAPQFGGGVGLDVAIADWVGIDAEIVGRTVNYNITGIKATAPFEGLVGPQFHIPQAGVNFLVDGGFGLNGGIGNPAWRVIAGLNVAYPPVKYGPPAAPPPPPPPPPPEAPPPAPPAAAAPAAPPETPPVVEPMVAPIAKTEGGVALTPNQITLPAPLTFGGVAVGAKLTKEDRSELDDVAALLQQYPSVHLQIEGHVAAGTKNAQRLSESRAQAVRAYLMRKGISGDRLKAVGMGDQVPIASNDTPEGRAKNNRVDLIVTER